MVPFKGEKDVCETLESFAKKPDVAQKLEQYKISKKCPVAKVSSVCLPQYMFRCALFELITV
jgi:hypothetical protein